MGFAGFIFGAILDNVLGGKEKTEDELYEEQFEEYDVHDEYGNKIGTTSKYEEELKERADDARWY